MEAEIKVLPVYCGLCPFSQIKGPYWNDDFEEEDYAVYCNKLKKIVHEDLHWTECAGTNSTHKGLDKRVSICPIDNIYDN